MFEARPEKSRLPLRDMTSNTAKIILGIDPGTVVMGYGIIEVQGSKTKLIATLKLKKIFDRVSSLIVEYCPDELAIEAPFYGKNVQSMLKLGRAQGVAIAAALYKEIPVQEYSPRKIKQAVTGKGSASKEQVAAMLKQTIGFDVTPKFLDATDALAVAVCHSLQKSLSSENKKNYTGWKAFLVNNPEKLKKS